MAVKTKVKTYQAFRGVDYSTSPAVISDSRASDILNMYVGEDGIMQKRPGWHIVNDFEAPINGIHYLHHAFGYGILFIHAGTKLYGASFMPRLRHFDAESGDVPYFRYSGDTPHSSAASQILRYVSGLESAEEWQVRNMDVNGDGIVNEEDANLLLRMQVGLEPFATSANGVLSTDYIKVKDASNNDFVLANAKSVSFVHEDKLYILDGSGYYVITPTYASTTVTNPVTSEEETIQYVSKYTGKSVVGYIPTTGANGHYEYDPLNEEGTNTPGSASNPGVWTKPKADEARNLLQTKQINTFTADGIHKAFYLTENNTDVTKVELYLKTRCHSENGKDIPDPNGNLPGVYYYWKYLWTEIHKTSEFSAFSSSASYHVGDLVKYNSAYYQCVVEHSGDWDNGDFTEVNAYTVEQATNATPIHNDISFTTKVDFTTTPAVVDENAVNIRVTFAPRKHSDDWAIAKDRGYIEKATIVTRFGYFNDNRYWFSGNPDHKNMDLMSAVDDPTYIPNDGWTLIGSRNTAIVGYLHYGSELAILKEDNEQDATIFMRSAKASDEGYIYFPVQQGAEGVGAISKWAICSLRDDPLFLTKEGVFAIQGTDASQERNVPSRSYFIDPKLKDEINEDCVAVNWGNYLLVVNPTTGKCFVADARSGENRNGSFQYDWCVWDNIPAKTFRTVGNILFFGTQDGKLCQFNSEWADAKRYSDGGAFVDGSTSYEGSDPYSEGTAINAYYVTKRDHLDVLDFKKTMLNDGGVILLRPHEQSSAQISIRTDRYEAFVADIQTDSDEPSVVLPIRARVKNFESLQTRIENNRVDEGLSIIGVQYRYAVTTDRR